MVEHARMALTFSAATVNAEILWGVLVPLGACLWLGQKASATNVLFVCDRLKVIRIDASSVPAQMI
jgi:hypothetical protein